VKRALLLALALAGPALAQEREPSSLRFARALSDRGWTDLAGAVLDALAADRSTPRELQAQLDLLRAELLTREARTAATSRERRAKADAARTIFERLARAGSDRAAQEARLRSGEVLLQVGEAALRRLLDPANSAAEGPAEREPARAEAREAFAAARTHFAALEAAWAEEVANAAQPEADPVFHLALAALDEARARFGGARACEPGAERDRLLADTIARLEAVATDYADVHDTTFEAGLLVGHAERERGRLAEAAAAFGGAAELADSLLTTSWRAKRTTDDAVGAALAQALWLRTQALCDQAAWQDALAAAEQFAARFPGAARRGDALAQLLEVERARATAGSGDAKAALELLEPLVARPANAAVARAARAAAREAAGQGSGDGLAPDDALRAAEALLERGQAAQGLARLRTLIAELERAGERAEPSLVTAWSLSARAYLAAARLDEAGACFLLVARRWPKDARAPRALLEAATCAGWLRALLPNEGDARRQEEALRALEVGYPDSPERHAASLIAGDVALGARAFPVAAASYAAVPEAAGELHDLALHRVALAWQREAAARAAAKDEAGARDAHARALWAQERALAWGDGAVARGVEPSSERGATLRRLQAAGWARLAELHLAAQGRDPAKAIEALGHAEAACAGEPARLAEARALAVQAHLAASDLAAAEAALAGLVAVAPEGRRTAEAERDVAAALDAAIRAAPDLALAARAADHYARWLAISQKSGLPVSRLLAARAGDRLLRLALLLNGLPEGTFGFGEVPEERALPAATRFEQAAGAYELAAGLPPAPGEPADGATAPWLVLVKLGQCLGFLGRFEACVATIDRAVALERLVDDQGNIVPAVARARTPLLHAYADTAQAARRKGDLARAVVGFQRLVVVCSTDGGLWWRSKYELLLALARKGDYAAAGVGLRSLARTYPGFDGGRFGYQAKLEALGAEVARKQP
jgi:hypothetical protein